MEELVRYKVTQQIPISTYWAVPKDRIIKGMAHKMIEGMPVGVLERLFNANVDLRGVEYITITMSKII